MVRREPFLHGRTGAQPRPVAFEMGLRRQVIGPALPPELPPGLRRSGRSWLSPDLHSPKKCPERRVVAGHPGEGTTRRADFMHLNVHSENRDRRWV